MLAGQRQLLEDGVPFVVTVFRAHVDVVEVAVQHRTGSRIDKAVVDDGLRLAALRGATAEGDRFDIVFAALGVDLGIQTVQRELGGIARRPLQRAGHADALLLVFHQGVAREARMEHVGIARLRECRAGGEVAVARAIGPATAVAAFFQQLALGVGHRHQRAEGVVGPGVGDQAGHARVGLLGHRVVGGLAAGGDGEAFVIERARGTQVDSGAQRAFFHIGLRGLAHDQLGEQVRGEHVEVEAAATVGAAGLVRTAHRGERFHAVDAHAGEVRP